MPRYFDSILKLIVGDTEKELLAQIQFLKAENRMLRSRLPKIVRVTPVERARLVRFGRGLRWTVLSDLISIVHPRTFARWANRARTMPRKYEKRGPKIGRPETPQEIREVVIRIARETGLGYTRIRGELKKLGIELSISTIANILKGAGMAPDPNRGEGRWDEFLRMHAESLWACDFFDVRAWTMNGLRQFYAILFIHIGTRRVIITPSTEHPTHEWVAQQARNISTQWQEEGLAANHQLRDRDRKFAGQYEGIVRSAGGQMVVLPRKSPNLNACAERASERAIQSIRFTCLYQSCGLTGRGRAGNGEDSPPLRGDPPPPQPSVATGAGCLFRVGPRLPAVAATLAAAPRPLSRSLDPLPTSPDPPSARKLRLPAVDLPLSRVRKPLPRSSARNNHLPARNNTLAQRTDTLPQRIDTPPPRNDTLPPRIDTLARGNGCCAPAIDQEMTPIDRCALASGQARSGGHRVSRPDRRPAAAMKQADARM